MENHTWYSSWFSMEKICKAVGEDRCMTIRNKINHQIQTDSFSQNSLILTALRFVSSQWNIKILEALDYCVETYMYRYEDLVEETENVMKKVR